MVIKSTIPKGYTKEMHKTIKLLEIENTATIIPDATYAL